MPISCNGTCSAQRVGIAVRSARTRTGMTQAVPAEAVGIGRTAQLRAHGITGAGVAGCAGF